jgi:hypothetical protein
MTNEIKTETTASKSKERLWRYVLSAGSSRQVEEGVDKVVSLPAAML